jgi:large subunit ribosomal protein L4
MELNLIDDQGKATAVVAASDATFGRDYNEALVHQLVTAYMSNARSATRMQKDRGDVKHSTKKPWRQKGTGRARAGMTSSPLWRGGGRIFPNTPDENYSHKINRKMYRAGVCTILSQLAREGRLVVVDAFALSAPKTKMLAQKLKGMGIDDVLIITDALDDNLRLSARNLPNVNVVTVRGADPVSLMRHEKVVVTRSAVAKIEEMLA